MRYHQYPTNYSWSLMPFTYGTSTSADFMKDIHDAINDENSSYPEYECDGTAVSSSTISGVFEDQFNYSNAIKADYNSSTVTSNISYDRPVILLGFDDDVGHAWVCDGYRRYTYYHADCTVISNLHLHMVWGWGSSYVGWYSFDNFNPGVYAFNDNKKMIYNIIP